MPDKKIVILSDESSGILRQARKLEAILNQGYEIKTMIQVNTVTYLIMERSKSMNPSSRSP